MPRPLLPNAGPAALTCPICNRPSDPQYRPFCSKRCADVDLGRWLTGGYAIPAEQEDDPDDDDLAPPPAH